MINKKKVEREFFTTPIRLPQNKVEEILLQARKLDKIQTCKDRTIRELTRESNRLASLNELLRSEKSGLAEENEKLHQHNRKLMDELAHLRQRLEFVEHGREEPTESGAEAN